MKNQCLIHPDNCPNLHTPAVKDHTVLLLWPQILDLTKTRPAVMSWLKIWLGEKKLKFAEFQTRKEDSLLCNLSALMKQSAILVADVTLRDPQVYYGIGIAVSLQKPVVILADSRIDFKCFPNLIQYSVVDDTSRQLQDYDSLKGKLLTAIDTALQGLPDVPAPPKPLASISKDFDKYFSTEPGKRTAKVSQALDDAWKVILSYCRDQLPSPEWSIVDDWYKSAYFDQDNGLLILTPSDEDYNQLQKLLVNPAYRHAIEMAIFQATPNKLNWTIKIDRVTEL